MGAESSIEWTDATWNPVTGCTEISPGCDHCYAKTIAERFRGVPGHAYEQGFDLKLWPERLELPLRWKKPRRIFVNSMSDLFHALVPHAFVAQVFDTMRRADHHIYQVLTKRPKHMARFFAQHPEIVLPSHIQCGTTIESDAYTWRADYLRDVPAMVRFISAEPLLSALHSLDLTGIQWLIVGGESGHGARPMNPNWARALRTQAQAAGVAFFFKQWGEHAPINGDTPMPAGDAPRLMRGVRSDGTVLSGNDTMDQADAWMWRAGKGRAGRLLDGREWNEMPR
jgi:protein gp37